MVLKFVQINIYKGKWLKELVEFLKKQDADFISMQEVSTGGVNLCDDKNLDVFEYLKRELALDGVFNYDFDITDKHGTIGNAILTKHQVTDHRVVILKEAKSCLYAELLDPKNFSMAPRHLLDCICNINGRTLHAMSVHGAWTAPPSDTAETLRQAELIALYLRQLNSPFVLGADFNNVIQSKTVGIINSVAKNLLFDSGVLETTNPEVHKIKPRGFLIDFIFTSPEFRLKNLEVPKITVSDHLPVIAELEF